MNKKQLVEIARSFSYKLNVGNFESRDFFCSQKAEVPLEDAEETSVALYHFCKQQVMKSVNEYIKEKDPKKVDFSNLAEKMPDNYFAKQEKLIGKQKEAKLEAMMQSAIDDKKDAKYEWKEKGVFNRID